MIISRIFKAIIQAYLNLQKKVYHLLDPDSDFWYSKLINRFIIATILLTVTAVILESESSLELHYSLIFEQIEYFSLIVFFIEYALRLWSAPMNPQYSNLSAASARWTYARSFFAIIDLVAILPFILSFFTVDTRVLRIIRLFRIFKITRYNAAMNTLLAVVKEKAKDLLSVIFLLAIVLVMSSSGIYLFEHSAQPDHFGSILRSMWWAIVTITTVGYGDVVPITVPGRIFAGLIMVASIGLVALPAGILASAFSEQLDRHKVQYRNAVMAVLEKGDITDDDRHILKSIQNKCNLSETDANTILNTVLAEIKKQQLIQAQLKTNALDQDKKDEKSQSDTNLQDTLVSTEIDNSEDNANTECPHCGGKLNE